MATNLDFTLITDRLKRVVAQYLNRTNTADGFEPLEGRDGAMNVNLKGSTVRLGGGQYDEIDDTVGVALPARANPERREYLIQNIGSTTLRVWHGDGTDDPIFYLAGGASIGRGAAISDTWSGIVTVKAQPEETGAAVLSDW